MSLKQTLAICAGAVAAVLLGGCGNATPITSGSPTPAPTITPFVSAELKTQTPGAQPSGVVTGPDSSLWFTEPAVNKIGKLNTQAVMSEYTVTTAHSSPLEIATGPDGNLWFTESTAGKVGKITTAGSPVTEYPLGATSQPWGIVTGPDGALWVTDQSTTAPGIWRVTTAGVPTFYALPAGSKPSSITAGSNGALWFLDAGLNKVGTVAPGQTGPIAEYGGISANAGLGVIIQGTDGAMWFTEQNADKIGRMTTSGVLTAETALTGVLAPFGITAGLDGNYYIADSNGSAIAQFIPSTGKTSTFKTPTNNSVPWWVTIGPDNEVYFTEKAASKLAQFRYF